MILGSQAGHEKAESPFNLVLLFNGFFRGRVKGGRSPASIYTFDGQGRSDVAPISQLLLDSSQIDNHLVESWTDQAITLSSSYAEKNLPKPRGAFPHQEARSNRGF
jgi:hypothetical protein